MFYHRLNLPVKRWLCISFFVHVNMSDSENSAEEIWEENIDSGGFSEISSPAESSSEDDSDHV